MSSLELPVHSPSIDSSNIWLNVRSLLCCVGREVTTASLQPALELLHRSLPNAQITVINYRELVDSIQSKLAQPQYFKQNSSALIAPLKQSFDAAIIFTAPCQSPYTIAYLCYLAGIPIRIGQSCEFGGSVLSNCIAPPSDSTSSEQYHLHLLHSTGISSSSISNL